jgi:hypothetical protein
MLHELADFELVEQLIDEPLVFFVPADDVLKRVDLAGAWRSHRIDGSGGTFTEKGEHFVSEEPSTCGYLAGRW